mmetsp:Transcript_23726/g.46443  ORF Transcript_23726/g.46443 Transcript_23726/m.46443 type:complete len:222 (+) Transcript_23726:354-1019(+)
MSQIIAHTTQKSPPYHPHTSGSANEHVWSFFINVIADDVLCRGVLVCEQQLEIDALHPEARCFLRTLLEEFPPRTSDGVPYVFVQPLLIDALPGRFHPSVVHIINVTAYVAVRQIVGDRHDFGHVQQGHLVIFINEMFRAPLDHVVAHFRPIQSHEQALCRHLCFLGRSLLVLRHAISHRRNPSNRKIFLAGFVGGHVSSARRHPLVKICNFSNSMNSVHW